MQRVEVRARGCGHRDHETPRARAHRGEIGQRRHHGLVPEVAQAEECGVQVDAENRHVGADDRLAHEGRENRGIIADVALAAGHRFDRDNFGYTLQYVIFVLASFLGLGQSARSWS